MMWKLETAQKIQNLRTKEAQVGEKKKASPKKVAAFWAMFPNKYGLVDLPTIFCPIPSMGAWHIHVGKYMPGEWLIFMLHVGKYASPTDGMGVERCSFMLGQIIQLAIFKNLSLQPSWPGQEIHEKRAVPWFFSFFLFGIRLSSYVEIMTNYYSISPINKPT